MRYLIILLLFLSSCVPSKYAIDSNPSDLLLDETTTLTLHNKSDKPINFYIVNERFGEITVQVSAKDKAKLKNFICGRYDVSVEGQTIHNNLIRPRFKNKYTYEKGRK
jgi:hypothetical protein